MEIRLEQGETKLNLSPPETLPIKFSGNNKTYDLLGVGEVTHVGIPKQFTIAYKGYIFEDKEEVNAPINKIVQMMNSSKPITLFIQGSAFGDFSSKVTLEDFEPVQIASRMKVISYTLSIKEARTYNSLYLQTVPLPPLPDIPFNPYDPDNPDNPAKQEDEWKKKKEALSDEVKESHQFKLEALGITTTTNYTVVEGDNFVDIVKQYYGSTEYVKIVMEYNRHILNPNNLLPGQVIYLPAVRFLEGML